jgi:autotransporter-associated beta strand protein
MKRRISEVVLQISFVAACGGAAEAAAATCAWLGSVDALWSTTGNWDCAGGPQTGDDLVFPDGGANKAMSNDIGALSVNAITFSGSGGGYMLTGMGELTITGAAAITSKATGTNQNTLALTKAVVFGAPTATIDTSSGADGFLSLSGPLNLNGSTLRFVWDATVPYTSVSGVISGTGGIAVEGTGGDVGLTFSGDNTFSGPVHVTSGYLAVTHAKALGAGGSAADGTVVHGGGTLILGADVADEHLMLQGGAGQNNNGMVQANGLRTWGGPVILATTEGATSRFNLLGSRVTFNGPVTGAGGIVCCNSTTGSIALGNTGNSYSGSTSVTRFGGLLLLNANNALSPNSGVVLGGTMAATLDMHSFSGTVASFDANALAKLKIAAGQKLTVNGNVALNGMQLELSVAGAPATGTVFTIVDKIGAGAVAGTFAGLAEGATLAVGLVQLTISYVGGDGNDVTLTVLPPPVSTLTVVKPGTGSGLVKAVSGAVDCGATCSDVYPNETQIVLEATADAGSVFTGWLGPCTGTDPCTFTIHHDTTLVATFAPGTIGNKFLDIDGDGGYDALTDALLALRFLSGITGGALTEGTLGANASRTTPLAVTTYLTNVLPMLDIDGDGQVDLLTDGVLIVRGLLGLTGDALIDAAIGTDAKRKLAPDIESYLSGLRP